MEPVFHVQENQVLPIVIALLISVKKARLNAKVNACQVAAHVQMRNSALQRGKWPILELVILVLLILPPVTRKYVVARNVLTTEESKPKHAVGKPARDGIVKLLRVMIIHQLKFLMLD